MFFLMLNNNAFIMVFFYLFALDNLFLSEGEVFIDECG